MTKTLQSMAITLAVSLSISTAACAAISGGPSPQHVGTKPGSAPPPASITKQPEFLFGYSDGELGDVDRVTRQTRNQANVVWLRSENEGVWIQLPGQPLAQISTSDHEWEWFAYLGLRNAADRGIPAVIEIGPWIFEPTGPQRFANWLTYSPMNELASEPRKARDQIMAFAIKVPAGIEPLRVQLAVVAVKMAAQFAGALVDDPIRPAPTVIGIYSAATVDAETPAYFDSLAFVGKASMFVNGQWAAFRALAKPTQPLWLTPQEAMESPQRFFDTAQHDDQIVGIAGTPWAEVRRVNVSAYCSMGQRITHRSGACVAD